MTKNNLMMKATPWILAGALAAALACTLLTRQKHRADRTITHYDTVLVRDTIRDTLPLPVSTIHLRTDTVRLAVIRTDTIILHDSVWVTLPITQREYRTDDYHAIISGYRPSLDYMEVFRQMRTVTVTPKPKRWALGLQAGYGWPHGTYIGVGISYNLLMW